MHGRRRRSSMLLLLRGDRQPHVCPRAKDPQSARPRRNDRPKHLCAQLIDGPKPCIFDRDRPTNARGRTPVSPAARVVGSRVATTLAEDVSLKPWRRDCRYASACPITAIRRPLTGQNHHASPSSTAGTAGCGCPGHSGRASPHAPRVSKKKFACSHWARFATSHSPRSAADVLILHTRSA
jgi:hypothetical protein